MNFAAMAAKAPLSQQDKSEQEAAEDARLDEVKLDGGVILKIAKHCRDNAPESVTGQLLGLDGKFDVEITNCFPFPNAVRGAFEEDDDGDAGTEYQIEMMRCLREVNVDAYTVGWYQTADLSSFSNETLLETQYNYQTNPLLCRKCVALVYDPIMTLQTGKLSIRALRLSSEFCDVYTRDPDLVNESFDRSKIFVEVPIRITTNALAEAFLHGLRASNSLPKSYDHLDLASNGFFEKNLDNLSQFMDELQNENGRIQHFQRQNQRLQNQINAYTIKVRAENQQRRQKGQAEIAEDLSQFKKLVPPSRLPSLVWMHQVDVYVDQVEDFARESALKLFLLTELENKK